ncbi:30S ribosomal protein S17 [Mycoplasma zalophi]|uniref:Small ribosomal subunit protein uS17 n=1 Tax=Mycoplasma zalophi TaxID=191287 RepID=A0ABS6DS24_9MOLU|nr:30S ribosomal protein S17 [Mycoplasma zalophi]MBU4691335.1 30S ribosomal protein S17 [Mycoplasma zalophi]MBU4692561.1 30S ribosomal protein S17 [Mycoplasma zalophi]MCU4117293.1 30S ribosomal protein S17 [Mycoplasma zalophi]
MERTNNRKVLSGKVVSNKNDKTVIVLVETYIKHPKYNKRFKKSKRFAVHDENNQAKLNDIVKIQETRPLSKTKHFRLVEVLEQSQEGDE